jgi:DNA-binding NarL/FixJ family response regulator
MAKIRILIADDHTLFRKGIRQVLQLEEDIEVVGEAATGRETLDRARALMPDVILMDVTMPDMDGVEATRTLHREMPHVGILFCTMHDNDELVFAGLKAGGRGYILKESDPETMLRAVHAVAHGESLLGPSVAHKVLRQFAEGPPAIASLGDELTERERQVLALIGDGRNNREIAQLLCISEKTVKNHISNIFSKLHLRDRAQAVLYAIRQGLSKG